MIFLAVVLIYFYYDESQLACLGRFSKGESLALWTQSKMNYYYLIRGLLQTHAKERRNCYSFNS